MPPPPPSPHIRLKSPWSYFVANFIPRTNPLRCGRISVVHHYLTKGSQYCMPYFASTSNNVESPKYTTVSNHVLYSVGLGRTSFDRHAYRPDPRDTRHGGVRYKQVRRHTQDVKSKQPTTHEIGCFFDAPKERHVSACEP